jgi:hypothetical protein
VPLFPITIKSSTTGKVLTVERWIAYPRHWNQVSSDTDAWPKTDFFLGSRSTSAPFHQAQRRPECAAFLNDIRLFSSVGGTTPIYSTALFYALKDAQISGLTEKKSRSLMLHDFREVIAHV